MSNYKGKKEHWIKTHISLIGGNFEKPVVICMHSTLLSNMASVIFLNEQDFFDFQRADFSDFFYSFAH